MLSIRSIIVVNNENLNRIGERTPASEETVANFVRHWTPTPSSYRTTRRNPSIIYRSRIREARRVAVRHYNRETWPDRSLSVTYDSFLVFDDRLITDKPICRTRTMGRVLGAFRRPCHAHGDRHAMQHAWPIGQRNTTTAISSTIRVHGASIHTRSDADEMCALLSSETY